MKTIKKKTQPEYFEQILIGSKRFEIRLNHLDPKDIVEIWEHLPDVDYSLGDRNETLMYAYNPRTSGKAHLDWIKEHYPNLQYEAGDTLRLREWKPRHELPDNYGLATALDGYYTGREVACQITSIVKIDIHIYAEGGISAGLEIDGHNWWSMDDIGNYGLVVLGLSEVLK
jgi:hypothetical protein